MEKIREIIKKWKNIFNKKKEEKESINYKWNKEFRMENEEWKKNKSKGYERKPYSELYNITIKK